VAVVSGGETVSTVSIIVPLKLVPLHKQLKFFRKAPLSMVFFLGRNILCHLLNTGLGDRKGTISTAPAKFARPQAALVYPMGRTSLQKLHYVLNAEMRRQINQGMHVIGIHIIDLHVNALLRGILG
jgi:hypothetical protein